MREILNVDIVSLIQSYGYLAVAVGTFLEGESVLLAAGAAASHRFLWMPAVIGIASLASFAGDQAFFHVGRRYGTRLLDRFPSLQPRARRVNALLERHHIPLILAVRFLYGLRIAGPVAIGMSDVHWSRFLVLNLAGAIIWSIVIAGIGYGFGQGLSYLFDSVDADEVWLLAAMLVPAVTWWLVKRCGRTKP
jgi:membrane protein DedA with SNARE-associated domain